MPFIGHREPDMADMGISPAAANPLTSVFTPHEQRAIDLVGRIAIDPADRQDLLEALGLAPTVVDETAIAS